MKKKFEIGDRVTVRAVVAAQDYQPRGSDLIHEPSEAFRKLHGVDGKPYMVRSLYRTVLDIPRTGIILGYTYRQTGALHFGAGSVLRHDQYHRVWLVADLNSGRGARWKKPMEVQEDDLEIAIPTHDQKRRDYWQLDEGINHAGQLTGTVLTLWNWPRTAAVARDLPREAARQLVHEHNQIVAYWQQEATKAREGGR